MARANALTAIHLLSGRSYCPVRAAFETVEISGLWDYYETQPSARCTHPFSHLRSNASVHHMEWPFFA